MPGGPRLACSSAPTASPIHERRSTFSTPIGYSALRWSSNSVPIKTRSREPERCDRPVYELGPAFSFARERLHFLVWANNYDARGGEPIWWHARKAARAFADDGVAITEDPGGFTRDLTLADGTALFIDGGPAQPPPGAIGDGVGGAGAIGVVNRFDAQAGRLTPSGSMAPSGELAPDQLAAVVHAGSGARVIARPGRARPGSSPSGCATSSPNVVDPATVTALAYNNKAAEELKMRCADMAGADRLNIRTLNSLGFSICNEFGGTGRLRVLAEPAVRDLLQRHIEIRRQSNTDTVAPYLEALSAIRLGLTPPAVVEEAIPDAAGIADAFAPYRQSLADLGAVDFDEQIYAAIEILLRNPEARAHMQARCRHLLVDEFQDLAPAHLLLIRLLSAPAYDCFGVGDDDQVIYGYSGASPEFLINFEGYFPGAGAHALHVNYRCPPAIVDAARHLLSYNQRRLDKSISPAAGRTDSVAPFGDPLVDAGPIEVRCASSDELAHLATKIIGAWRLGGVAPDEIAVLARVNSALLPVQVACIEAGIPSSTPLSTDVLSRTGIRTALAYLRIGSDPGRIRRQDLQETIRRPSRGIAPKVVEMLTGRPSTSIDDIRRLAGRLDGRDVPKLEAYADNLERVAHACTRSSAAALEAIRTEVGLGETMDILDASRASADRSTHADDLAALEAVASLHPDAASFEAWMRELLSRPGGIDGEPVVLLSTVHRIKGREWDHVIIFGASRGLFPHRLSDDEEGERRVFHVALTRAKRQVIILADASAPSSFVAELDGHAPRVPTRPGPSVAPRPKPVAARGRRSARRRDAVFSDIHLTEVTAVIGLDLEYRGSTGTVTAVTESGVVVTAGSLSTRVPFGTDVRTKGHTRTLVAPDAHSSADTGAPSAGEASLRAWRSAVASRDAVPAYVILKDAELLAIVQRSPQSLAELATCRGMGPIRLERWGDEILAALDPSDDT